MEQELLVINTEEELLEFADLRGRVIISKFRNTGPFAKDENYTGMWKILDKDVRQAIGRGQNADPLRKIWDEAKGDIMNNWIDKFKDVHQKNTRGGAGLIK